MLAIFGIMTGKQSLRTRVAILSRPGAMLEEKPLITHSTSFSSTGINRNKSGQSSGVHKRVGTAGLI